MTDPETSTSSFAALATPSFWGWVLAFGSVGIVMGALTTFIGLGDAAVFGLWMTWYALWLVAVYLLRPPLPFAAVFLGSCLSGLFTGLIQSSFRGVFAANNPAVAELVPEFPFLPFALAAGAGFGVVVGGLAWLVSWLSRRRD